MKNEHWMISLQKVFYPFLVIIGVPSNTITFMIFWRRSCGLSPSCRCYLMAISVADTLVLIQIVLLEMILQYYTIEPFWTRVPWCMIRDVFSYGAYNASVWLVVCFTIERFFAIKTRHLKPKICTKKCSLCIIASVFICSHAFSIPYFWSNESRHLNGTNRFTCVYNNHLPSFYVEGLVWFQATLVYIIPYIIIFALNGSILKHICNSNKVQCETFRDRRSFSSFTRSKKQKRKSVVLLVTVSMTFAYLCTTRFVTQIMIKTLYYNINRKDYTKTINVAADIGTMLDLTNAAVNMYLYACTQYRFRKELLEIAKAVKSCKLYEKQKHKHVIFFVHYSKYPPKKALVG
ncbi:probable G-protein coupled receptor 139 [Spea bombifrons]|uniref:probable G-protein coupled receptor 139 n=1 Tax=Spea bombifrons TaxID=233779 RepID=UPI00234B7C12|nr:probable G-protein coupled receptor 139 [Spea bombifrons]